MTRCESTDDITGLSVEERFEKVTACNRASSCQDGYLDVISIRGAFHLGQIKVGLSNAQRLCQCREAVITISNQMAVQVDGEPWRQKASRLTIRRKADPAVMLHRSAEDGGIETEVCSLLDWAEERKMIDRQIHAALMKEFSRRIEGRTRQRRHRAGETGVMSTLKKAISSGAIATSSSLSSSSQQQQQQQIQQQQQQQQKLGLSWYQHPGGGGGEGMYSY
jgi:macrodomain Ter protein organizer (MatP/YcbG family)